MSAEQNYNVRGHLVAQGKRKEVMLPYSAEVQQD